MPTPSSIHEIEGSLYKHFFLNQKKETKKTKWLPEE
jgi:hypothetical protein